MYKRKTAIDLTDLAIGILVLGVIVVIGSKILLSVRDSRLTDLDTYSTTNETLTTVTETGESLGNTWVKSVDVCNNATTTGEVIPTTNYTVVISESSGLATITATGAGDYNNSDWNCTYTSYNTSRPDWALPNDAATGIAEYGNWFDIIVIVGIAGVILSLIFMAFGKRGDEGVGTSY